MRGRRCSGWAFRSDIVMDISAEMRRMTAGLLWLWLIFDTMLAEVGHRQPVTILKMVLADPRTPASFANAGALGDYLAQLRNAQFAASWQRAHAYRGSGGGGGSVLGNIMYRDWQARGGAENHDAGPAPIH